MAHPTTTCQTSKKRCRVAQLQLFHVDLEAGIITLKDMIMWESFKVKGKFLPALKPKLQQLALQVILLDKYNKNFFAQMPQLFLYNQFTMTKLIKWLVYAEHHQLLSTRQEELLEDSATPSLGPLPQLHLLP